jgi:hypothetical protein
MKIRKLLPLVLLAVASLFFLSSCDQLLDAIFSGDNTLNMYVQVTKASHVDWAVSTSTVSLYNGAGSLVAQQTVSASTYDGTYGYFYVSFTKLAKGTYTVYSSYAGGVGDLGATTWYFEDPNTLAYINSITLPDSNSSDLSGKTVTTYSYPL